MKFQKGFISEGKGKKNVKKMEGFEKTLIGEKKCFREQSSQNLKEYSKRDQ